MGHTPTNGQTALRGVGDQYLQLKLSQLFEEAKICLIRAHNLIPQIHRNPQEEGRKECIAVYESLIILYSQSLIILATYDRAFRSFYNLNPSLRRPPYTYELPATPNGRCNPTRARSWPAKPTNYGFSTNEYSNGIHVNFNVTHNIGASLTGEYGEILDIRSREMRGFIDRKNYGITMQKDITALSHV